MAALRFGAPVLGLVVDRLVFGFVAIARPPDYETQQDLQIKMQAHRKEAALSAMIAAVAKMT
jgi:hypothetical protein